MMILTMIICYLMVGAVLGLANSKGLDELIERMDGEPDIRVKRLAIWIMALVMGPIALCQGIVRLVTELKKS